MAVIWEQLSGQQLYEVRQAGNTLRLYRDGVLHTQYNPTRPLTLGVWDLLTLPAFALASPPRRVLLLGVGGGAVLRLLHRFFPDAELTGIDLDPLHLELAQRFFGVSTDMATLECADAREWIKNAPAGDRYDLVIDDLFAGKASQPVRVFDADKAWLELLMARLSGVGALVMNFAAMADLSRAAWASHPELRVRLPAGLALTMPCYANAVGAFFRTRVDPGLLRQRLLMNPQLARQLRSGRFRVAARSLRAKR